MIVLNILGHFGRNKQNSYAALNLKCNILFTNFITTVTMVTHESITIDYGKFESHSIKKKLR